MLGVGEHLKMYPEFYEPLFVCINSYKPDEMLALLKYPIKDDRSNKMKSFLEKFLKELDSLILSHFLIFCTGSKILPRISGITVKFEQSDAIFGHTCMCYIVIPFFVDYQDFKIAMLAAISGKTKKSFTAV